MLCVEFPKVQCTDFKRDSEWKLSPLWPANTETYQRFLWTVTFSSGEVSPEWRLNQGFGTKKKCPFPLNRGVPSIKVSQRRGSTVFVSSLVGLSQFIPSFCPANSRGSRELTFPAFALCQPPLFFSLSPTVTAVFKTLRKFLACYWECFC